MVFPSMRYNKMRMKGGGGCGCGSCSTSSSGKDDDNIVMFPFVEVLGVCWVCRLMVFGVPRDGNSVYL